ncbi:MAG: hypothetical protein ABI905_09790 [Betaproteobacteria bacterium]
MDNNFLQSRPQLRKIVRYAEIIIVLVLLAFAIRTYRELKTLQAVPVILPSYWFNAGSATEPTGRVQARGSWVGKQGTPEFLHTTTIECNKAKMQCVESSAVVSVSEGGFLESVQTVFDVDTWSEAEIVTKPDKQPCSTRLLTLNIIDRQALAMVTHSTGAKNCKPAPAAEQSFTLVTGPAATRGR